MTLLAVAMLATKELLPLLRWSIRLSWSRAGWRTTLGLLGAWCRHHRDISRREQDRRDDRDWPFGYGRLLRYASSKGTALVPRGCTIDGIQVGWWIDRQRWLERRGRLPHCRVALLEQLPGWDWADRWADPSGLDRLRARLSAWHTWVGLGATARARKRGRGGPAGRRGSECAGGGRR